MNFSSLLLLMSCSCVGAFPATMGCGAECAACGPDGICLFAENDIDVGDSFRNAQLPLGAASLPAVRVEPPMPWAQGPSPQEPPLYLRQMATHGATAWDPLGRAPWALPGALPRGSLGFQSTGVLENKAQELSDELQRAETHETLLQSQNQQLRRQLEQWKVTGANIADREAKVVAFLAAGATRSRTPTAAAAAAATAAAATRSRTPAATAAQLAAAAAAAVGSTGHDAAAATAAAQVPMLLQATRPVVLNNSLHHGYLGQFLKMAGMLFMLACLWKSWCYIRSVRKGEVSWPEAFGSSPSSQRLQPVLRAMGLAKQQYKVEVGEIHLGSLFAGSSDVRVNFHMGTGVDRRTKALKNTDGTFLRFDDVLELSVCSTDPPCTICVTDKQGDLAHVEVLASELIRLATRPHQEYFRTELIASRALGDTCGRKPYVAMRLRNIHVTPATGVGKAAEKRAYGSFAV